MTSWVRLARGADAANALLARVAPERVSKAPDPLTVPGFEATVRALALRLLDVIEEPEQEAAQQVRDILDVNWARLSASQREQAIRQAEAVIGRVASQVVEPLRAVLRDDGQKIIETVRGAAIGRFDLPIAAAFGVQDQRIVEHAASSQAFFVTDQYGKRANALGQRTRGIVAQGLDQGLDRNAIGQDLEAAIGPVLGRGQSYYPLVASIYAARSRTWSLLSSFEDAGIEEVEFSAVLDEATCFAAGTRVLLGDGKTYQPIERIRTGASVMSCKGRPRRVTATLKTPHRKWGSVVLDNPAAGPLVLTRSHGVLTAKGWMRAQQLRLGDLVSLYHEGGDRLSPTAQLWGDDRAWGMRRGKHDPRTLDVAPYPHPHLPHLGKFAKVVSIVWAETGRSEDAYDLEVADDEGYVAEGVVVHNSHICRALDGQRFSVRAGADRYRAVAASEQPEEVKTLQPFARERRIDDGRVQLYVPRPDGGETQLAIVEESAMGLRDARGSFSGVASRQTMEAAGVSAPPLHGHCRSDLIPV